MTEAQLYEKLGRQAAEIDNRALEYSRLLLLLAQVCSGEVARERVSVDLAAQTWTLAAEAPPEPEPTPEPEQPAFRPTRPSAPVGANGTHKKKGK